MAVLTNLGLMGNDIPTLECDTCGMSFMLTWNLDPAYDRIEYCPFCGDYIDEILWLEDEDDGE